MKYILMFLLLFIVSCSDPTMIEEKSIGLVKKAELIPTSFNKPIGIQITCDSMFVVILYSSPAIPLNREAFLKTDSRGGQWFTADGMDKMYKIAR